MVNRMSSGPQESGCLSSEFKVWGLWRARGVKSPVLPPDKPGERAGRGLCSKHKEITYGFLDA